MFKWCAARASMRIGFCVFVCVCACVGVHGASACPIMTHKIQYFNGILCWLLLNTPPHSIFRTATPLPLLLLLLLSLSLIRSQMRCGHPTSYSCCRGFGGGLGLCEQMLTLHVFFALCVCSLNVYMVCVLEQERVLWRRTRPRIA